MLLVWGRRERQGERRGTKLEEAGSRSTSPKPGALGMGGHEKKKRSRGIKVQRKKRRKELRRLLHSQKLTNGSCLDKESVPRIEKGRIIGSVSNRLKKKGGRGAEI